MADARRALHLETGRVQRAADPAGAGKGADGRAGGCQARQFGEQPGGPHLGVFRRGETVEEPGIDLGIQLRQLLQHIADQQGQGDPSVIQQQALEARVDRHVLLEQRGGKRRQFGPEGQGPLQVGMAQRVLLDADEMQARTGHRALFEELPGAEKIQSGTEPRLADHQPPVRLQGFEAFLQAILFDKDIAGFFQARGIGKIHIVEHPGVGQSLVVPVDLGVGRYAAHGGTREQTVGHSSRLAGTGLIQGKCQGLSGPRCGLIR